MDDKDLAYALAAKSMREIGQRIVKSINDYKEYTDRYRDYARDADSEEVRENYRESCENFSRKMDAICDMARTCGFEFEWNSAMDKYVLTKFPMYI